MTNEQFEERAAIMEYDGNLTREMDIVDQAERKIKELYERTYIIVDGVYRHDNI